MLILHSVLGLCQEAKTQLASYEIITKGVKYGLVDSSGQSILNAKFDTIFPINLDKVGLSKNGDWGLYSSKNEKLIRPRYDRIIGYNTFVPYDPTETYDSELPYLTANKNLRDLDLYVVIKDEKFGIMESDGKVLLPMDFDWIRVKDYRVGFKKHPYFEVTVNDKVGIYDLDAKVLLEPSYSQIKLTKNTIIAEDSLSVHFFNLDGTKMDLPYSIDGIIDIRSDGSIIVTKDGKQGVLNDGKLVVDIKYDAIESFEQAKGYKTKIGELYGVISPDGTLVIEPAYDDLEVTPIGFIVSNNGKKGFLQFDDRMFLAIELDDIKYIPEPFLHPGSDIQGLIISKNGKKGFHLPFEKIVVEPAYDEIEFVGSGFLVSKDGLQGYMLLDGTLFLPIAYEDIRVWKSGHTIIVRRDGKEGLLDQEGKEVLDIVYDSLALYPSGIILAKLNGKYGLYATDGAELTEPKWSNYKYASADVISFSDGKDWFDFSVSELLKAKK